MYEKYYDILKTSGIMRDIDINKIEELLALMSPEIISFEKDAVINFENEIISKIGFILKGVVHSICFKPDGYRQLFNWFDSGEIIAQTLIFSSFENKMPTRIVAKTDCTILFVSTDWLNCKKKIPDAELRYTLLKNLLITACNKTNQFAYDLEYFKARTVREKLYVFLKTQASMQKSDRFILKLNRSEMANHLCISRPSLSRELAQMKRDGIIDYYKSTFKIIDEGKLVLPSAH